VVDHCVLQAARPDCLRCTRCGEEEAINLPMEIEALVVVADAFAERHRACPRDPMAIARAALNDVARANRPEAWRWARLRAATAQAALQRA